MRGTLAAIGVLLTALAGAAPAAAQPSSWVRPPTETDTARAAQWVTFSAENGEPWAQYMLGTMYEFGRGMQKDDALAFEWYLKAAKGGDLNAMFRCGLLYHEGRGTPRDDAAALDWLGRAEAGGSPEAANLVGVLYAFGNGGVTVDEARAVALWKKAARAEVPDAAFNLGAAYANGRGVDADPEQGASWYVKAAYAYLQAGYRPGAERAVAALEQLRPDHPELPALTAILVKGGPGATPPEGPPGTPVRLEGITPPAEGTGMPPPAAPPPEGAPPPANPPPSGAVSTPAPGPAAQSAPEAAPEAPPAAKPERRSKKHGFLFWRR